MKNEIDFSEILGMIIAFGAVVVAFVTTIIDVVRGRKSQKLPPEALPKEPLRDIYKQLFPEDEEEEKEEQEEIRVIPKQVVLVSPPPKPVERDAKFEFRSSLDTFRQETNIEKRKLEINLHAADELVSSALKNELEIWGKGNAPKRSQTLSPARAMLKKIPSKKALIIAAEIVNPPLSLRKPK